jgi:hypothetical protein
VITLSDDVEIRRVQPYEATKPYRCPGCNGEIPVGLGHLVVVPLDAPDLRRHRHHGCWRHRDPAPPGHAPPVKLPGCSEGNTCRDPTGIAFRTRLR